MNKKDVVILPETFHKRHFVGDLKFRSTDLFIFRKILIERSTPYLIRLFVICLIHNLFQDNMVQKILPKNKTISTLIQQ